MKFWKFPAKKYPARLRHRLQKYGRRNTPPDVKTKGELWGKGQLEIGLSDTESWRGQIQSYATEMTEQGVRIKVKLFWFAKRKMTRKVISILKIPWTRSQTVEWVEIRTPYETEFVITRFWQNKSTEQSGIVYPKRLFFTTSRREKGCFTRRDDPENLHWQHGGLFDPVLKKRFECKPSLVT